MENYWIVNVCAENVDFKILKTGDGSKAYQRDWKAAHVRLSKSKDGLKHVMTVHYHYGKRIDIMVRANIQFF